MVDCGERNAVEVLNGIISNIASEMAYLRHFRRDAKGTAEALRLLDGAYLYLFLAKELVENKLLEVK